MSALEDLSRDELVELAREQAGVIEHARTRRSSVRPSRSLLMVVHFIPARRVIDILESMTGETPSLGFVHGMVARAARALAEANARIRTLITLAYAICV